MNFRINRCCVLKALFFAIKKLGREIECSSGSFIKVESLQIDQNAHLAQDRVHMEINLLVGGCIFRIASYKVNEPINS
jgi:hypothetical protein